MTDHGAVSMRSRTQLHQAHKWRVIDVACAAAGTLLLAGDIMEGQFWLIAPAVVIIVLMTGLAVWQTKRIASLGGRLRPRPDYTRIAKLERRIYGTTFEHAGAPSIEERRRELTPERMDKIRREHMPGKSRRQIAREFGPSDDAVTNVINRRRAELLTGSCDCGYCGYRLQSGDFGHCASCAGLNYGSWS